MLIFTEYNIYLVSIFTLSKSLRRHANVIFIKNAFDTLKSENCDYSCSRTKFSWEIAENILYTIFNKNILKKYLLFYYYKY